MYKLVKNELYKLFHKRSTFIFMGIMIGLIGLVTFFYSLEFNNNVWYDNHEYIEEVKYSIDNFDTINGSMQEYAYLNTNYETQKHLINEDISWKREMYDRYVYFKVENYYNTLYVDKNEDYARILRATIDEDLKRLESNDWKYFVNLELVDLNNSLTYYKGLEIENVGDITDTKKELEKLEYQKYLLEYRLNNNVSFEPSYLSIAIDELSYLINDKVEYDYSETDNQKEYYKDGYARFMENEYIIENKVDTNNMQSLRYLIASFFNEYGFLVLIFIIMIAGAIFSDEFNKGTIKSLLTIPYTRTQIYFAKFLAIISMLLFIVGFMLVFQVIIGGIVYGVSSLSIPVIGYNFATGSIETMNCFTYFLCSFLGNLPAYILLGTLAFAFSLILNNTAFAIALTFCGYLGSTFINSVASGFDIKILDYFVTTNWDLTYLIFGGTSPYGISVVQSLIVCLVYFLIMIVVALIVFRKKNIKNI